MPKEDNLGQGATRYGWVVRKIEGLARALLVVAITMPTMIQVAGPRSAPAAASVSSGSIPVSLPGGLRPTVSISPSSANAGQSVTVSGEGVASSPGVRIVWLAGDSTATAAVVLRQPSNAYSAVVTVPTDLKSGAAKVCAAVTGTVLAEFACADFTVGTPPPGSVRGSIPLAASASGEVESLATLVAVANLYDRSGMVVASTPLAADGSFAIAGVPPGSYTAGITGTVPTLVDTATVQVTAGQETRVTLAPFTQCLGAAVVAVRASPTGKPTDDYDFGVYIGDSPGMEMPKVTFEADLQITSGATVRSVPFLTSFGGNDFSPDQPSGPTAGSTYAAIFTVSGMPAGLNILSVEPQVVYLPGGRNCSASRPAARRIKMVQGPFQYTSGLAPGIPLSTGVVVWAGNKAGFPIAGAGTNSYSFIMTVPYNYDAYSSTGGYIWPPYEFYALGSTVPRRILPVDFPDPAPYLPLFGSMQNRIGASFTVEGNIDLDGNVTLQIARVRGAASFLGVNSWSGTAPLVPESSISPTDTNSLISTRFLLGNVANSGPALDPLGELVMDVGPQSLGAFNQEMSVFNGVLWSYAGLVNVNLSVSVGVAGEIVLTGKLRPLEPYFDVAFTPRLSPRLTVSLFFDALFGVVSGGADTIVQADLRMPFRMNDADLRLAYADNPCESLQVLLNLWLRVDLLFTSETWNLDSYTLVDYSSGNCATAGAGAGDISQFAASSPAPPRVMAAPAVASGPEGRLLLVYVDDTTPDAPTPTMQVMARSWDSQTNQWGAATPLTDGSRAVMDPVAAFVGTGGNAVVAWTENTESLAEAAAAGNDLNAHLKAQEIFYAIWNGTSWSTPARLTNDAVPDGRPSIAGDATGVTLAWVRFPNGDVKTRTDWRVAVAEWDLNTGTWSAVQVLNATTAAAMNAQVSSTRQNGKRVLVWTLDSDGDLTTNSDRRLAIADWVSATSSWNVSQPALLPTGAESPSAALDPTGQQLTVAFLVRGLASDGLTSIGIGNQAALWTAQRNASGVWQRKAVVNDEGLSVRGERPQVGMSSQGEPLVLFRRFGDAGTNGVLGQLALTQVSATGDSQPPVYLTDEPRQHWQPALAVNQTTGQAVAVNVGRAGVQSSTAGSASPLVLAPASTGARPAAASVPLAAANEQIESALVEQGADPALDPILALSKQHATIGSSVVVTATLRNLGRSPASGLAVTLYSGSPGSGSLLQTIAVTGTLAFNDSRVVPITMTVATGTQPIFAEVTTSGSNTTIDNDRAAVQLGALPPPTLVRTAASARYRDALELTWQPPAVTGVAGYRILRSSVHGGPYELVGEATGVTYSDLLLTRGETYYYVVQAFDATSVLSPLSLETPAQLHLTKVYLPLMMDRFSGGW